MDYPSNRLAELMAEHNVTDADVASRVGVQSTITVWRWREGRGGIPDSKKLALAELFDVSVPYLMGWDRDDDAYLDQVAA